MLEFSMTVGRGTKGIMYRHAFYNYIRLYVQPNFRILRTFIIAKNPGKGTHWQFLEFEVYYWK